MRLLQNLIIVGKDYGEPISVEQISILIKVNSFRFTGRNKRQLLWEAHMKINKVELETQVHNLFRVEKLRFKTPHLPGRDLEDAFDELEYIGFPLCNPFDLLTEALPEKQILAKDLSEKISKRVTVYGYLITNKTTRTVKGDNMYFGNFLDVKGDFIDTVHFPSIANTYPFRGRGVYQITGKVIEEFDCVNIEVTSMEKLAIIEDPRYADDNKYKKMISA
jgi:error-prone DNA polymerase